MRLLKHREQIFHVSLVLLLVLLGSSCAGTPGSAGDVPSDARQVPDWTYETPEPSDGYTYFVGYADGPEGAQVQAMENATASLIAEIMRYIGVTISAESTATARSTLDSFEADLVQTVKQSSNNRVSGFQITDRFTLERDDGVSVYLLGRFETKELEAEKRRIASLFQERIDAVAVPEAKGRELMSAGAMVDAARSFVDAASAAASSSAENASIQFERNINSAREALSRISIEKLNDNLQAFPGQAFPEAFRARVHAEGIPQRSVAVLVGYQSRLANGRMTTRSTVVMTDEDGIVSFMHPAADFVGDANVSMRLDLGDATESLYGIPQRYASLTVALEDVIASKRISFDYTIVSRAREIPASIFIVDQGSDGSLSAGATAAALTRTLVSNGFSVSSVSLDPGLVASGNDAALAQAAAALPGNAERLIFGITRIVSIREDGTQKIAMVSAEIKVMEIESGRILYSAVRQIPAFAGTEAGAVDAARGQLGQNIIGEDLAASLP